MSTRTRAVVFDRDGVLIRTRLRDLMRDLRPLLPLDEAQLGLRWGAWLGRRALATPGDEDAAVHAFLGELAQELALPEDAREALASFDHGRYVEAYPDAAPALDGLRARGLRVGVLTNNSASLSAAGPLAAVGLHQRVDVALSAQQIGASKPEPRAYLAICEALAARPDECVFFDDVAAWVQGAREAGLRAFRVDRSRATHDVAGGVLRDLHGVAAALTGEVSS